MVTVDEVNRTFAEKGLHIALPLPGEWEVKNLNVLEKRNHPGGVAVLLSATYVNDHGEEVSDLFQCDARLEPKRGKAKPAEPSAPLKNILLPLRQNVAFTDEAEARSYLDEAISHLLQDKDYQPLNQSEVDLCFQRDERRFFINLAVRCDETGYAKAEDLIRLRHTHGGGHDYGLVVPAFQDSLGVSIIKEERWVWRHEEHLGIHRIGVYAVDNWNPNQIYAFTVYPEGKELRRYFMTTTTHWPLVRDRYVASREKRIKR